MSEQPSVNIASQLAARARQQPYTLAAVFPHSRDRRGRVAYTHWTYRQLDQESDHLARGLESIGVRRGIRTVLMVKPSLEFFAVTFALFKVGAVPVLVDPGMGLRNLGQCLGEAEPEAFIGSAKAQAARALLGWARRSVRLCVTHGRRWLWGGLTLEQVRRAGLGDKPYPPAATRGDETAAILFTSGSTGVAKGAIYTHAIFEAQVDMLRQIHDIRPGEIDLCTFPLFALFAPALGMTAVIPDMDATRPGAVDPRKIIEAIGNFGVTNLFGSPALLDRVGRFGAAHGVRLPSLQRVISAGAPVRAEILDTFSSMLSPGVQIITSYGATEALPICCIGSDEVLSRTRQRTAAGAGVCVGRPVAGIELAVMRISDDPIPDWSDDLLLPDGDIGEIVVRGPVVTRAYCNRAEATALAKIADPVRGGIWHRMGDLGYLDESGRVWFCGRKSQRVVTAAGTLFTIPCEAVFNAHPQVARSALVGIGPAGAARPVVCVELKETGKRFMPAPLAAEMLALGAAHPHTRPINTFLVYPGIFPVDIRHNAKIGREKLTLWAARRLS